MKHGKYFDIPESAADVERLWGAAKALSVTTLPSWLAMEDAAYYRSLTRQSVPSRREESYWQSEKLALEDAGFIVDKDPHQPSIDHVYIPAPNDEVWSIGIYTGSSPFDLHPDPRAKNPVVTREQVNDLVATFVADPFMIRASEHWYMFFEVMNWRSGKGEIGLATSRNGFMWTYQQIVLVESFHLSYPYVFEWQGEYYMIPESFQAGAIRLYKATNFPSRWSLVATLLEGSYLVDPSIFRYRDKWWLFAETNPDVKHDCLRLYFADKLTGPWVEHPQSPIVSGDARIARPGGRVQQIGNEVFRFAQDCSQAYGSAVSGFKITALSTQHYAEEPVSGSRILSASGQGWNADGMHHLDPHRLLDGSWIACVDGKRAPFVNAGEFGL